MDIKIEEIEYGLKLFYELKYKNGDYDYSEIPKIVDTVFRIESWIKRLQKKGAIEGEKWYKINGLLEQYYRTEFLKYVDNKSINEYLESKRYFPFDAEINMRFLETEQNVENDYYLEWLKKENLHIEWLKKHNKYNKLSEDQLIKNITYENYSNQKIYLFLKQYFISNLDYLFSSLHVEFLLGNIKTSNNKEVEQSQNAIIQLKSELQNNGRKQEKHESILFGLNKYKFDELNMVKGFDLNVLSKHIFNNKLPYQIAYLDYLGFIDSLCNNYCSSKKEMHSALAKILATNERYIRGHINVLNDNSAENKNKYTSYLHKDKVEEHYKTLK